MMNRIITRCNSLLKRLSRNEWFVRALNLPRCEGAGSEPGVVMIQIDGLSHTQFQRALSRQRLPFIRKLLAARGYTQKPFYAGMPSATPGVQAELFYGVKTAVPAFEFIDRKSGKHHAMFYPESANTVAHQLEKQGEPLLKDGSSYSNIFSGGAKTARYCTETMNLQSLVDAANPLKLIVMAVFHTGKLLRIIGFALLELVLAVCDFFKGVFYGKNFLKELKFIPTRLFLCVGLRELVRFRVKMDLACGVPVVSANFFGYDEQAHRRGPGSAFAHWTLKGIDETVKDIYQTAIRSDARDYRVVIYSDHGQEAVENYENRSGRPLKQTVRELFHKQNSAEEERHALERDDALEYLYRRAGNLLFGKTFLPGQDQAEISDTLPDRVEITTMGPLGHIYLPESSSLSAEPEPFARILNKQAGIPLVLFQKNGKILAVNASGVHDLERDPEMILGRDHPFPQETAEDLKNLCCHPNAGDLVISGWNPEDVPLSFNIENGAHGGPGREETRGFVLLPPCMKDKHARLRPLDLRNLILAYLGKTESFRTPPVVKKENKANPHVRLITYNIHSCIHMDGRVNPDRTADVIAAMGPDIAALQEVDAGRKRTRFMDQGRYLAARLGMNCEFFPVVENRGEQYGLAILSRFPFVSLQCLHFPRKDHPPRREPRGIMMAVIETPLGRIRVVNTHLGLHMGERRSQIEAMLANDWIAASLKEDARLVICGDFNAGPQSYVYRKLMAHLTDVQMRPSREKPKPTFFSGYPMMRLDHIFVSKHFRPGRVRVPSDYETRVVSDHLPVCCELLSAQKQHSADRKSS